MECFVERHLCVSIGHPNVDVYALNDSKLMGMSGKNSDLNYLGIYLDVGHMNRISESD